ncbi:3'-5' exonuclease [Actinosynnema sp. CS-041913]|uniref:3'-5' exonuclease n=1 Tax=Actinosynnema sp. CS-041913 TaxID=3239917 RepID=UPI003D90F299
MTTPFPTVLEGHPLAVVDVEGNGAQPPEIVEIAVLPVDGPVTDTDLRTWLVRPKSPVNGISHRIHGIGNRELEHCPRWHDIAPQVEPLVTGRTMVAHAATVDYRVIADHLPTWRPPMVLDTLRLARHVWPDLPGHRLPDLAAHARLDTRQTGEHRPHRAGYDAWCVWLLVHTLLTDSGLSWDELVTVAALKAFQPRTEPEDGLW